MKNELNSLKAERKIKENNIIDSKENIYRKKSQEKSQNKNGSLIEKSASIPCYYNNINIFTSNNTGDNSNKNHKFDRSYKDNLPNNNTKSSIDDKLKIYENNNKHSRKNNKSRSTSAISKN